MSHFLPKQVVKTAFTEKPITSYILRIIVYYRGTSHAARHTPEAGCASAVFSTHGISYSQVCGRVRGYQKGTPEAFGPFNNLQTYMSAGVGLDGILISHGDSIEKYIWAYVTGLQRIIKGLIINIVHVLTTGLMALLHHS